MRTPFNYRIKFLKFSFNSLKIFSVWDIFPRNDAYVDLKYVYPKTLNKAFCGSNFNTCLIVTGVRAVYFYGARIDSSTHAMLFEISSKQITEW